MPGAITLSLSRGLNGQKMTRPQRSLPEIAAVGNRFGFCERLTVPGYLPARSATLKRGEPNSLRRNLMLKARMVCPQDLIRDQWPWNAGQLKGILALVAIDRGAFVHIRRGLYRIRHAQ